MRSAHSSTGEMAGFIHLQTKLVQFMDSEDELLQDLTPEELGYTDIIVNVDQIMYVFWDHKETVIMMNNNNQLIIKENIHEVHQKIKRTTALFMGQ